MTDAQPEQVTVWLQGHWKIENRLHWARDVVTCEDHHQLHTANGPLTVPEIMHDLHNLPISVTRLFHSPSIFIASTAKSTSRRPNEPSISSPSQAPEPTLPAPPQGVLLTSVIILCISYIVLELQHSWECVNLTTSRSNHLHPDGLHMR